MKPINFQIREDLAGLLTIYEDSALDWAYIEDTHEFFHYRGFLRPTTAKLEKILKRLRGKNYIAFDGSWIQITPHGQAFLFSLGETIARLIYTKYPRRPQDIFHKFSVAGWIHLKEFAISLPNSFESPDDEGIAFVYMVLLDRNVTRKSKFKLENPKYNKELQCLYVGMSSHNPLQRFHNHKRGHKSSRYVRNYGICLLPEMYAHLNPMNQQKADETEKILAYQLRERGYGIMGVYAEKIKQYVHR